MEVPLELLFLVLKAHFIPFNCGYGTGFTLNPEPPILAFSVEGT